MNGHDLKDLIIALLDGKATPTQLDEAEAIVGRSPSPRPFRRHNVDITPRGDTIELFAAFHEEALDLTVEQAEEVGHALLETVRRVRALPQKPKGKKS